MRAFKSVRRTLYALILAPALLLAFRIGPPVLTRSVNRLTASPASPLAAVPERPVFSALAEAYEALARLRVDRGLRLLSRGRMIVTDRLHGHILGLCLGIPQVVLDNSYRKISSTFETWTALSAITRWADSIEQSMSQCQALAGAVESDEGISP